MLETLARCVEANAHLDDPRALRALYDRDGYLFFRNVLEVESHDCRRSLSVSSPRRNRELTVPRGRSSSSAISPGV